MSGYTKGEWSVEGDWSGIYIEGGDNLPICDISGANKANAQLIAAAPELLEACKFVIHTLNEKDNMRIILQQTINKAEGGV